MHDSHPVYDYIVVGAGSAGATLAARLSENPNISVCLIEAGNPDRNPLIHIPFGLSLLSRVENIGWGYYTEAQPYLAERELFWPRGKTLGGSSSINAMCYIRGHASDYDHWESLGATGWDYASVLPYFKKAENFALGGDAFHGDAGPLHVSPLRHHDPLSERFVNAAKAVDLPILEDFNRNEGEGLGFYHVTQVGGERCSSARGYLSEARSRPNLTIRTQTMVERVVVKQKRAVAVQVRCKGVVERLHANYEVLLCGGAINSPHLLMLSGIGPAQDLLDKGIHVQADVPGVGQNLQDHLDAIVQYRCQKPGGYAVAFGALPQYIKATWQYLFRRNGIFSSNIAEAGGFVKSSLAGDKPDMQFHFLPAILQDHGRQIVTGYGYGLHVCALYPKSRGTIRLQSNHPDDHPEIQPNYLQHEDDARVMIDGVRLARRILQSGQFSDTQGEEFLPGQQAQSDEDILAFIRQHAETIYHPVGTCKMGADDDEMAVVDAQLRVRGVEGLRVIDASVMPTLIGGNTNAPTIMIAERAADFIKNDWKARQ